ncbi:MAG TPA: hypothetical protein VFH37_01410 [Candidatus Saccharimonadales bacterium]|nr:hypothetical protein [Candidatus Saccharimonadales bacterium]
MSNKAVWSEYEFYRSEPPEQNHSMTRYEEDRLLDNSAFLKHRVWRNMRHFRPPHSRFGSYKPIQKLHLVERGRL